MSVEGGKKRALIDQIVAGIADQSDAVEDHPSGEFGGNDDSIQSEGKMQPRLEMGIGGVSAHTSSVARVKRSGKRPARACTTQGRFDDRNSCSLTAKSARPTPEFPVARSVATTRNTMPSGASSGFGTKKGASNVPVSLE